MLHKHINQYCRGQCWIVLSKKMEHLKWKCANLKIIHIHAHSMHEWTFCVNYNFFRFKGFPSSRMSRCFVYFVYEYGISIYMGHCLVARPVNYKNFERFYTVIWLDFMFFLYDFSFSFCKWYKFWTRQYNFDKSDVNTLTFCCCCGGYCCFCSMLILLFCK